jgi:hypothetical protein
MYTSLIPKVGPESVWPLGPDGPYQAYETNVKGWCESAYEEARLEHAECEDLMRVNEYIDFLCGKQWPQGRPSYRSKPMDNRVWRLFWELVSYLTDLRGVPEVFCYNHDFDQQAKILNQSTLSWWLTSDADMSLAMIVVYGLLTTGYAKLEWNQKLAGGYGDIDMIPVGPNELLPLQARYTLASARAQIYQTVQPLDFFRRKFPIRGVLVQPDTLYSSFETPASPPPQMTAKQFSMLSPGMQQKLARRNGPQLSTYPRALYREFWLDDPTINESKNIIRMGEPGSSWEYLVGPGERIYPRGRLIIMGGREIMHDGPNPYWHGRPPFAALRMNIVPWQFPGISELRSWMPLQEIINQILAGILDMIKRACNPGFIAPKNAFSDNVWNSIDWSMPGAKASYNPAMGGTPQFAPQPNLPGYVMQVANWVSHELDQASGMAAVSEAVRKKQIPSGDTLEAIRDSTTAPTRLKGRNIEAFLRDLGRMNLFNIFQFYNANRRVVLFGPKGLTLQDYQPHVGSMVPSGTSFDAHIQQFGFLVKPGSMLAANQTDREMKLARLAQGGAIDNQTLLENMTDLNLNVPEVMARLKEQQAAIAQGMAPAPKRRR